jgi:hypothetical protein
MNERIKELEKQCWQSSQSEPYALFDVNKFAELIVRECISIMGSEIVYNDNYKEKNNAISDMMELLMKHFGVEE